MPTMKVSLPDEFIAFVEKEVASGEFGTASDVVLESLRLMKQEKAAREDQLSALRQAVGIGVEQAKQGRLSKSSITDIAASMRNEQAG